MPPLFAPDRVYVQAAAPRRPDPQALPVPWAVSIEDRRSARVAVACLRERGVSRVQVVVGPCGRVYVGWTD